MYLDKKIKNQYTVGKVLRAHKNIRKVDPTGKAVPMPKQLKQYTDQLVSKGLEVKNLSFAHFSTKNGLPYPGLIATQKILANTILVKVPVECLLTTRDAYLSDIQKIFVQNPKYYGKQFTSDWQDRILLTFLLYEYQKQKKSKWFNLIRNLPRQIDYAIFWNEKQLKELQDQSFTEHIERERKKFYDDCDQLIKILKKYPEFFHKSTITQENAIWLHTHLVTRCFGKYFEYTTMVPFAELFNHECTDVYYSMYYNPQNPHTEHEQFYEEKELQQEDMNDCDSSNGSYDAQDFEQDDEIQVKKQNLTIQQYYKVKDVEILTDIRNMRIHIFTFLNFSDSISFQFLRQSLLEIRKLSELDPELRKKKCEQIHSKNVKYIKKIKQLYNKVNRKYYTYGVRQKRSEKPKSSDDKQVMKDGEQYFNKVWQKDKFDKFYMLCSTKDQFQKGSQVYFCYGRLPNKLLLMRYGIALQHNKYDHMFVKINMKKEILQNPDFVFALQDIKIKMYKRFKIKRTRICLQLITFFRIGKWNYGGRVEEIFGVLNGERQLQTLYECKECFLDLLSKYKCSLEENQKKLYDKTIGYHGHFALIYKIEQQRILTNQIKMIDYAIALVVEVMKGANLRKILSETKQREKLTMQIMMEDYLKTFEIGK